MPFPGQDPGGLAMGHAKWSGRKSVGNEAETLHKSPHPAQILPSTTAGCWGGWIQPWEPPRREAGGPHCLS